MDSEALRNSISTGSFCCVSDGSYADNVGTACCVLWDGSQSWHITFAVPGLPEDQCAYRSELAGIYCQIWFIVFCCEYHSITDKTLEVACDGLSALNACFSRRCSWNTQHRDLVSGCQNGISRAKALNVTLCPRHVYGHQDANPWNLLDLRATLNQIADDRAVVFRHRLYDRQHHSVAHRIYGESWIPLINDERIIRNQMSCLRLSTTWPRLLIHWNKKRTRNMDLNQLDYRVLEKSMRALSSSQRRWLTKHVHRWEPQWSGGGNGRRPHARDANRLNTMITFGCAAIQTQ